MKERTNHTINNLTSDKFKRCHGTERPRSFTVLNTVQKYRTKEKNTMPLKFTAKGTVQSQQ